MSRIYSYTYFKLARQRYGDIKFKKKNKPVHKSPFFLKELDSSSAASIMNLGTCRISIVFKILQCRSIL